MKKQFSFLMPALFILSFFQTEAKAQTDPVRDWKMKSYYMVILKIGPDRNQDSTETSRIQAAHLANMGKMYDDKKLILAGPFLDDSQLAGILILNVPTVEEADKLASLDPAVLAGRLIYEVHPWYGPSTLGF
jgi:uncharacterized protein